MTVAGGSLRVRALPGVLDAETRQAITEQKAELIKALGPEAKADAAPVPRSDGRQLSFFQERLWVINRLQPENTAYNLAVLWPGAPGVSAEQTVEAIERVAARHAILRSTYFDDAGRPGMRIAPKAVVRLVDMSDLSDIDAHDQLEDARSAASQRPFDLENEQAVQWTVYRVGARIVVLLSAHHIALDKWSIGLLRHQLLTECARVAAGNAPQEDTPLQYADYAAWQRQQHATADVASELDWWEKRLADAPQLSTFPPDSAGDVAAGTSYGFCWDRDLTAGVNAFARAQGVTVYMALLAACATVMRAHTGQADIVLGSPAGQRERPEFETVIGPFVSLMMMRLDLSDDPTFAQLLTRARDAVLDGYDHRRATFESIIERLNPVRTFDRSPLFQVSVVLHDGVGGATGDIWSGGAIQDVTWFAAEIDGQLQGSLEYRTDLYERGTIARVASHLETVMRAVAENPALKVSQISLLSGAEYETVTKSFNASAVDLDKAPFIEQFERQVQLTPSHIAVAFEGAATTYDALNRRANQIARGLKAAGVGEGVLVGVRMQRSTDLLATLLAIQKLGCAYLPLDPAFPRERQRSMLADSGARMLVVDGASASVSAETAIFDLSAFDAAAIDDSNLDIRVSPDATAYILYTSGSTGQPNGVVVEHGALSNFLGSMRKAPGLASDDVLAAVTTISFDISGLELYLPLLVGARVELVAAETAADGPDLAQQLQNRGATVMQATPATWRLLLESGWRAAPGFRALCGGEPLARDLADQLLETVSELWNLYGPTETTIWSTAEKVERDAGKITVGRPIANTQVYVLNAAGQPCPTGVLGEIWIGGAGVARGYHHRDQLTAQRFMPDPFAARDGARLYRTGDIGCWQADGRLVHSGRADHQVKVRGHRIELGEIEAALRLHPAVRQASVIAREAGEGDARLVAYIVYAGDELTGSEARTHLRQTLPDYMLPSVYVPLEAIPLTPNGKIDRRALPDPYKHANTSTAHVGPATPMERVIAHIWQDLLHVERVGVDDNFFELGGHSLLSLRAAAAIQKETGWRIPPRTLFFQTLRQVAAAALREGARAEPA